DLADLRDSQHIAAVLEFGPGRELRRIGDLLEFERGRILARERNAHGPADGLAGLVDGALRVDRRAFTCPQQLRRAGNREQHERHDADRRRPRGAANVFPKMQLEFSPHGMPRWASTTSRALASAIRIETR